jgi:hypothetical protein
MNEQQAARPIHVPMARQGDGRRRAGRVRTCLPARVERDDRERWRYPAEDQGAVVRGAD